MAIALGKTAWNSLRLLSALSLLVSTSARADCPSRRFIDVDQESRFLLKDSPIVFVGKILKTRLIKKATNTEAPIFEDEYLIKDMLRGSHQGPKVILRTLSIGDGDEPPQDAKAYSAYIKQRSGSEKTVVTHGYFNNFGRYVLFASNGCPYVADPNTPHGKDLVAAMKNEVKLEKAQVR